MRSETCLAILSYLSRCVVPRAVPIVEAMAALVLADLALMQLARSHSMQPH
jgi:chorismate synthase